MTRLALIALVIAGRASVYVQAPEVVRLQALADSFEPGWQVKVWPADGFPWNAPGYLATMAGAPVTGTAKWLNMGGSCVGCAHAYDTPRIYLRDEALAKTRCADLAIAGLFARRQEGIQFTFAERHVAKEAVKLLARRGWADGDIRSAQASCPRASD